MIILILRVAYEVEKNFRSYINNFVYSYQNKPKNIIFISIACCISLSPVDIGDCICDDNV